MRIEFSSGGRHDGVRLNYVRPARIARFVVAIIEHGYF